MKISITDKNREAIEKVLLDVNGKAYAHSFTSYQQIQNVARRAEQRLSSLDLPLSYRSGAQFCSVSANSVANAYQYSRQATLVLLARGCKSWYLIDCQYCNAGTYVGDDKVYLTAKQDDKIVTNIRKNYEII